MKNSVKEPCYDCGSTIPDHCTFWCEMSGKRTKKDLRAPIGSQHWDKSPPLAGEELTKHIKEQKEYKFGQTKVLRG